MKQVYILTNEQVEELKRIQTRISSDLEIIAYLLEDELIKPSLKSAISGVLLRIESNCDDIEDILEIG